MVTHGRTCREAVEHLDVPGTEAFPLHVTAAAAVERLSKLAELLEPRAASDLSLQQDSQPEGQGRLVDDQIRADPVADPSGVGDVESDVARREKPTLPCGKACATLGHDTSSTGVVHEEEPMTVQYLNPPALLQSPVFSQAVVVEPPSRTVYVGGQNGVDAAGTVVGGMAEQTAQAVDNARIALDAAGGQLTDVISWTVAVVAGQDLRSGFSAMHPALAGRDHPPIITVLVVAGLAVPGALVEISAIAVLP